MMNEMQKAQQQADNKTAVVVCKLVLHVFPHVINCTRRRFSFSDGVRRCGIFCAISIIVETLKTEQIIDVFQIVKALRIQNTNFVTDLVSLFLSTSRKFDNNCESFFFQMEYKFCYDMTLVFLESFTDYANFRLF